MAHAGKDTGGSQFFVCHGPQRHLDGVHTVFGQVTDRPGRGRCDQAGRRRHLDPGRADLHVDFAVVADYALIDQHGKLSVLGIFQHVWVEQFPAMHPRTHLVVRVRGRRTEIGSHHLRIRFVDDQGQELLGGEGTVQFGEPPAGVTEVEAGAILVFDVPLPRPGHYAFEITLADNPPVRVPLSAGVITREQAQGQAG